MAGVIDLGGAQKCYAGVTMKLRTRRQLVESVPDLWDNQYSKYYGVQEAHFGDPAIKSDKLRAIDLSSLSDSEATDEIDRIIGNRSWTRMLCEECEGEVDALIRFQDRGECCVDVCSDCLMRAVGLISG